MDGRPAPFLDADVRSSAAYDTKAIERLESKPSGAEGTYVEQLCELGYVE